MIFENKFSPAQVPPSSAPKPDLWGKDNIPIQRVRRAQEQLPPAAGPANNPPVD